MHLRSFVQKFRKKLLSTAMVNLMIVKMPPYWLPYIISMPLIPCFQRKALTMFLFGWLPFSRWNHSSRYFK